MPSPVSLTEDDNQISALHLTRHYDAMNPRMEITLRGLVRIN